MEKPNNHVDENLPKPQSMKTVDKKHMTLVYVGLALMIVGLLMGGGIGDVLLIVSIVVNCIGLYQTFKYKKAGQVSNNGKKK